MKRTLVGITIVGVLVLLLGAAQTGTAQGLEDLNIQIHGYATQGFLYTTDNNFLTTTSSDGSPNWTEAVVNVGAVPIPRLRVNVQVRYELLGNLSNAITLDYATADYAASDHIGVRFGKVKIPSGLLNEIQDIDPSYLWALLPQSVYPLSSRNGQLSLFGGVGYGTLDGRRAGKLEYWAWGGEAVIPGNDGYLLTFVEEGFAFTSGLDSVQYGGAVHWKTPLRGLMFGVSDVKQNLEQGAMTSPYGAATFIAKPRNQPAFFSRYEKDKLMVAFEYSRFEGRYAVQFAGPTTPTSPFDNRGLYAMASYKVTDKLTAGAYHSESVSHLPGNLYLGTGRYSKDWTVSGRYDFNQFLYVKAEEHFIAGTSIGYDTALNPGGLKPNTKLTILKVGVSF